MERGATWPEPHAIISPQARGSTDRRRSRRAFQRSQCAPPQERETVVASCPGSTPPGSTVPKSSHPQLGPDVNPQLVGPPEAETSRSNRSGAGRHSRCQVVRVHHLRLDVIFATIPYEKQRYSADLMDRGGTQGFRPLSRRAAEHDHASADGRSGRSKGRHREALKGFGSGIFEVALKHRTDAYRAVYALQLEERVWVLHAFQKKAKQGIKTPKKDIKLIGARLKRLKKELRQ